MNTINLGKNFRTL